MEEIINFGKYFITIGNLSKNSFCVIGFFLILFFFILFLFYFTVHGISTGNEIKIVEDENKKRWKSNFDNSVRAKYKANEPNILEM